MAAAAAMVIDLDVELASCLLVLYHVSCSRTTLSSKTQTATVRSKWRVAAAFAGVLLLTIGLQAPSWRRPQTAP
jgi:hypothetical protein